MNIMLTLRVLVCLSVTSALRNVPRLNVNKRAAPSMMSAAAIVETPIFSFQDASSRDVALAQFERIDDVIMGGVSSSALGAPRAVADPFAVWRGTVRVDGGGFCGVRTRPLAAPLDLREFAGLFVRARLASDGEPGRRAWKATLRTRNDRGEVRASHLTVAASSALPPPPFVFRLLLLLLRSSLSRPRPL